MRGDWLEIVVIGGFLLAVVLLALGMAAFFQISFIPFLVGFLICAVLGLAFGYFGSKG